MRDAVVRNGWKFENCRAPERSKFKNKPSPHRNAASLAHGQRTTSVAFILAQTCQSPVIGGRLLNWVAGRRALIE